MKKSTRTFASLLSLALLLGGCAQRAAVTEVPATTMVPETSYLETSGDLPAMEETVILDRDGVRITAKESAREVLGQEVLSQGFYLTVENSNDRAVSVTLGQALVNHCALPGFVQTHVPANSQEQGYLSFLSSCLSQAGIQQIGQADVTFNLANADALICADAQARAINTSALEAVDENPQIPGTEIYNRDGLRIVAKYNEDHSIQHMDFFASNHGERDLLLTWETVTVNGQQIGAVGQLPVPAVTHAIGQITLPPDTLQDLGIQDVTELMVSFHLQDPETHDDLGDTGMMKLSAE